jgi:hypothetical protein
MVEPRMPFTLTASEPYYIGLTLAIQGIKVYFPADSSNRVVAFKPCHERFQEAGCYNGIIVQQ